MTGKSIGSNFSNGTNDKIQAIIVALTQSYTKFLTYWKDKVTNNYKNFFSLRDYYNLIKTFLKLLGK